MNINLNPRAPEITLPLTEQLRNIENITEIAFVVKVSYHESHTIFYLKKVKSISFEEYYIEIQQNNNSVCYLNYDYIQEYSIINTDDITDMGVV